MHQSIVDHLDQGFHISHNIKFPDIHLTVQTMFDIGHAMFKVSAHKMHNLFSSCFPFSNVNNCQLLDLHNVNTICTLFK
jgi:hypothetical protein